VLAKPSLLTPADEALVYFNGVDGRSGGYARPPLSVSALLRGSRPPLDPLELRSLALWQRERLVEGQRVDNPRRTVAHGVDPCCLETTGWAIALAEGERRNREILDALAPLIRWRRTQVGSSDLVRVFDGIKHSAIGRSEDGLAFRARNGVQFGVVDPRALPYYLLIVADPRRVPFEFDSQLAPPFAVGRLWFDEVEQFARYAEAVVAWESTSVAQGAVNRPPRAAFFGPRHPDDPVGVSCSKELTVPLARWASTDWTTWEVSTYHGDDARKAKLVTELSSLDPLRFLFFAGHGVAYVPDDELQIPLQGAPVLADWRGPIRAEINEDHLFSAKDLPSQSRWPGLVAFLFGCFTLGTPRREHFEFSAPYGDLARDSFVAELPQRLLGSGQGPLAVIGHIERAWPFSYRFGGEDHPAAFADCLARLLEGHPVGAALEPFRERYAQFALLERDLEESKGVDPIRLAEVMTAANDARNYGVFGDPAVRLVRDGEEFVIKPFL
jgi:hypothetical protein